MAENTITTNGNGGKELQEWQKERIEMARLTWKHVLDPIMTFAELTRGYGQDGGLDLTSEETSAVLRLLVIGGYTELKIYCTPEGGHLCHLDGEDLERLTKNWDGGAA